MDFNDIVEITLPVTIGLVTPIKRVNRISDYWGMPRIDAPDNNVASDLGWSYVATDHDLSNLTETIHTGVNVAGSITHYELNNGSLGSLTDISDATTGINRNPVVAYDQNYGYINYCWYHYSSLNPPSPSDQAYIGLKVRVNGSLWAGSVLS